MAKKILICDDDQLIREMLDVHLAGAGYETALARDGRDALAKLREGPHDAVVLDLMMPVMQGCEVLREMRADTALADLPVLMLSAKRQECDILGAFDLGADDYVIKPFQPHEVIQRITSLVGAP